MSIKFVAGKDDYRNEVVKVITGSDLMPNRQEEMLGALPRTLSHSDAESALAVLSTDHMPQRKLTQLQALFGGGKKK